MHFSAPILAVAAALSFTHASPLGVISSDATNKHLSTSTTLQKRATHNGIATVYDQGGVAGSCGHAHTDGSKIVAIGNYWWNKYGQEYFCDRMVRITNTGPAGDNSIGRKGNSIRARVADTCPGCESTHLDLSRGAWDALTNGAGDSVVGIKWYFCPHNNPNC